MRLILSTSLSMLLLLSIVWSCSSDDLNIELPSQLMYNPASLSTDEGVSATSVVPTVEGGGTMSFAYTVSPSSDAIVVNTANGLVAVGTAATEGVYTISITVTNEEGSTTFNDAYTVTVNSVAPTAPSNLVYAPNQIELVSGDVISSVQPTVSGTQPITFQLAVSPDVSGNITIDENTGVLTTSTELGAGTYTATVTATNSVDAVEFQDVYTFVVTNTAVLANNLNYSTNTITVTEGQGSSSVVPTVSGTSPMTYALTTSPDAAGAITINATTGVISVSSSAAVNVYTVEVTVNNAAGDAVFPSIFTITVEAAPTFVTFTNDILPIMQNNCGGCHLSSGSQTDYTDYTNSKNNVTSILDRVQRAQGSPGFMPKNGTPLTSQEIALIQQWQTDGLQE